jgi:hypothetical protein
MRGMEIKPPEFWSKVDEVTRRVKSERGIDIAYLNKRFDHDLRWELQAEYKNPDGSVSVWLSLTGARDDKDRHSIAYNFDLSSLDDLYDNVCKGIDFLNNVPQSEERYRQFRAK